MLPLPDGRDNTTLRSNMIIMIKMQRNIICPPTKILANAAAVGRSSRFDSYHDNRNSGNYSNCISNRSILEWRRSKPHLSSNLLLLLLASNCCAATISCVPELSVPGGVTVRFNSRIAETIGNVVLIQYKKINDTQKKTSMMVPKFPKNPSK